MFVIAGDHSGGERFSAAHLWHFIPGQGTAEAVERVPRAGEGKLHIYAWTHAWIYTYMHACIHIY